MPELASFLRGLALAQLHEGGRLRVGRRQRTDVGQRQVDIGEEREHQRRTRDSGTHDETADLLQR